MKLSPSILVAALVSACCGVLAACSEKPKSIQEISKNVFLVEERGHDLLVGIKTKHVDGGHSDLFEAAEIMEKAARFQMDRNPTGVTALEFQIWVPTVDKYGKYDTDRALILRLPMEELHKVEWDGFTSWDALNVSEVAEVTRLGREMTAKFCADKNSGRFSKFYCAAVLTR